MSRITRPLFLAAIFFAASLPLRSMTPSGDHPGAAPLLLGTEPVRKDLAISPAQASRLDGLRAAYKATAREIVRAAHAGEKEMSKAEGELAALTLKYNARSLAVLTGDQVARFEQILHRALGGTMLVSPKVQSRLGLSPTQTAAIEKLRTAGVAKVHKINARWISGEITDRERVAQLSGERRRQADAMVATLNAQQRDQFLAMGAKSASSVR